MGQANVFKDIHAKEINLGPNLSTVAFRINDAAGIARLRIFVDSNNAIQLEVCNSSGNSQVRLDGSNGTIVAGTSSADSKALVTLASSTKGILIPRMTEAQRDAIAAPPVGLMIINTTTSKLNLRGAAAWEVVTSV